MKAGMDKDEKTKLQYASKYSSISNYWKYYIGQSRGLKRMRVYEKKLNIENNFKSWVESSEDLQKKYSAINRKLKFGKNYMLVKRE